jgi:hypothetical protein
MLFGKPLSAYVRFQRGVLLVTVVVGLLRLALSLAGVPNDAVKWLSMTVVMLASVFYYGVRVHTSGFGGYKHILPLVWIQSALMAVIAIAGILVSVAGAPNIFSAPEYGGTMSVGAHLGGHLVFGLVVGPLAGWAIGSLVMFVTKKVSGPRPARAAA